MHRHNYTSGACQENPRAPTRGPQKESLTDPFLTPPEAFVKDHPDLYQRDISGVRGAPTSQ